MRKSIIGMFIFGLLIVLLLSICVVNKVSNSSNSSNDGNDKKYNLIMEANDFESIQKNFLLDNPGNPPGSNNGGDPTKGNVDYSYAMPKDSNGGIKKNVNGDMSWSNIPSSVEAKDLIQNYENGVVIKLSDELVNKGDFIGPGSLRLSSKKLFKGGLFVFDVEACPYGPGIWPSLWLNGFVGGINDYHEQKGTKLYEEGMKKLAKQTVSVESFLTCKPNERLPENKPRDEHLSEYLKKDVYVASWPAGGEIDILENVNFSDINMVSIHTGASCETTVKNKNLNFGGSGGAGNWLSPEYEKLGLRSGCGSSYVAPGSQYSGCKNEESKANGAKTKGRYNCPVVAFDNSGNNQVLQGKGSFGAEFNKMGGGIYACQWISKKIVNIWFWPRSLFDSESLRLNNGPLSKNPKPDTWKYFSPSSVPKPSALFQPLIVSYDIDNPEAITTGCDFNFQSIMINITVGGDWAGAVLPNNISVGSKPDLDRSGKYFFNNFRVGKDGQKCSDDPSQNKPCEPTINPGYISQCYKAKTDNLDPIYKYDIKTGCNDGAFDRKQDAVFFTEAKFKIKSIKVFQTKGDENIW